MAGITGRIRYPALAELSQQALKLGFSATGASPAGSYPKTPTRFCRKEHVLLTHMYAAHGILTHDLLTFSAMTAQPFPSF